MTDIEKLFAYIDTISYPDSIKKVAGGIQGIAFFPGGKGTFDNSDILSNKSIMILGQDFDCEKNYQVSFNNRQEDTNKNPTWRNLQNLLKSIDKSPNDCFFTNAIMGVRNGEISTGKSPGFKDKKFLQDCQNLFLYQIKIQKPKAIFVLGKYTAEFLAPTSDQLSDWEKISNFVTLDKKNIQIKKDVIFNNGVKSNLIILTHPSFQHLNVHRRSFNNFIGIEAEIKMAQEII
jgi:uracil-DNA glycosylase